MATLDDRKRNKSEMDPASSPDTNSPKRRPGATIPDLPADTPEWAKMLFKSMHDKFDNLELELGKGVEFATEIARDANFRSESNTGKINELSDKLSHAVSEIAVLKQENRSLKDKIINLESYSRRDNLLFYGIQESREEKNKDCAMKLYDVLKSMKSEFSEIPIIKCHRKGKYVRGQVRPIIAKFFTQDRDAIWSEKVQLKGTSYFVGEDFPYEVEQNRRLLLPVFLHARKLEAWKDKVFLKGDKLIVNDSIYTVETIDKLPADLNPDERTTRENDEVFVFHGAASSFSNSYPCTFKENGVNFNNVEQYVNYHKAVAAKDDVTATRILGLKNVTEQRRMGKAIPNFAQWRGLQKEKIELGVKLKFAQNTRLAQILLNTGDKLLGEANGYDTVYGTGVRLTDPNTLRHTDWKGSNLMGQILMKIRQDLRWETSMGLKQISHVVNSTVFYRR